MRVGPELKAARKKAGLTVEVISKRTKINASKLVALEKNDFKNLPTGLYLFSFVRAYAREVRIDPEPIVERLRAEFAEKDALDALQALNATGALAARNLTDAGRSNEKRSNFSRNAAIAAAVLGMAAGAGAYFHYIGRTPRQTSTVSLSLPAPAAPVATPADVPQQAAGSLHASPPTKSHMPKPRTARVAPRPLETVAAEFPRPARIEEPEIEELMPEAPVLATAP
jgi:cytoskeleton protein RodZ